MIKKITIKNFKSIETLDVFCNETFNVIIGENNIGKTTIFEAIHLWKICYDSNIKKDKKQFYAMTKNIPLKTWISCVSMMIWIYLMISANLKMLSY